LNHFAQIGDLILDLVRRPAELLSQTFPSASAHLSHGPGAIKQRLSAEKEILKLHYHRMTDLESQLGFEYGNPSSTIVRDTRFLSSSRERFGPVAIPERFGTDRPCAWAATWAWAVF